MRAVVSAAVLGLVLAARARPAAADCGETAAAMRETFAHPRCPDVLSPSAPDWLRELAPLYRDTQGDRARAVMLGKGIERAAAGCAEPLAGMLEGMPAREPPGQLDDLRKKLPDLVLACACRGVDVEALTALIELAFCQEKTLEQEHEQHQARVRAEAMAAERPINEPPREPEWSIRGGLRIAIGAAGRSAARTELTNAWDMTGVLRVLAPVPAPHRFGFVLEAGTSHGNYEQPLDLVVAGIGPLFEPHGHLVALAWMPRFLTGTSGGSPAVGVRNGLVLDATFITFEIAHDVLRVAVPAGTYTQHNLRAMFNIDLIQLPWMIIQAIGSD